MSYLITTKSFKFFTEFVSNHVVNEKISGWIDDNEYFSYFQQNHTPKRNTKRTQTMAKNLRFHDSKFVQIDNISW